MDTPQGTQTNGITADWLRQQPVSAKLAVLIMLGWASSRYGCGLALEILTQFGLECLAAAKDEQAPIDLETRTMLGVWLEQRIACGEQSCQSE